MFRITILLLSIIYLSFNSNQDLKTYKLSINNLYEGFAIDSNYFCALNTTIGKIEVYAVSDLTKLYEIEINKGRGPNQIQSLTGFFIDNGIIYITSNIKLLRYDLKNRIFLDEKIFNQIIRNSIGVFNNDLFFTTIIPEPNSGLFGSFNLDDSKFRIFEKSKVFENPSFNHTEYLSSLSSYNTSLSRLSSLSGYFFYYDLRNNILQEFFIDKTENDLITRKSPKENISTQILFRDHILLDDTTILLVAEGSSSTQKYQKNALYLFSLEDKDAPKNIHVSLLNTVTSLCANDSVLVLIDNNLNEIQLIDRKQLGL